LLSPKSIFIRSRVSAITRRQLTGASRHTKRSKAGKKFEAGVKGPIRRTRFMIADCHPSPVFSLSFAE
jgi:hypothetical protein